MDDDEIPIAIDVSYDELSHRLEIWQEEARENAKFGQFDAALHKLLLNMSDDNIKR